LIYNYKELPSPDTYMTTDLEVKEILFTSNNALQGILGFLSSQRDQVRSINYHDHFELPLEYLLKEPLAKGGTSNMWLGAETAMIGAGIMVRTIQLRRILAMEKFGECNGEVTLKINDELNPSNSEPLFIDVNKGKVEFKKKQSTALTLHTNIATFSSIYWGALTLKDALYYGLVEIDGKDDSSFLFDFLNFPRSICLDHF